MKKIKLLTITLVIIAVTMVSFIGVYKKVQNRMENQVKDYDYSMNLKGSRNIRLTVNSGTKTVIKDAEGKEVEDTENLTDEQIAEKGYVKEEILNNAEEAKTVENYQASKKVIEKRLEKLGVTDYIIKLDEQTGDILIELAEDDRTDEVVSNLGTAGKFEIIDAQTKEVLMNNSDIKQVRVMYGTGNSQNITTTAGTTVYLDIEFNKEGAKKLEDISNKYVKTETETQENATTENGETTEDENTETTKQEITMKVDDEEIMTTSFEEPNKAGRLQLSIGAASTDEETIQGYITQASGMASVLDIENMPLKYDVTENQYVLVDITENQVQIAIYIVLAIIVLALIAWLIKYKRNGALGVISYIGFISVLMLIVRYANVSISIEGLFGFVVALILNYILVSKLISNTDKIMEMYKDFFIKMIPIIIMIITFSFISWTPISSYGMIMFWGIALMVIYNILVTNSLLKIETRKEK